MRRLTSALAVVMIVAACGPGEATTETTGAATTTTATTTAVVTTEPTTTTTTIGWTPPGNPGPITVAGVWRLFEGTREFGTLAAVVCRESVIDNLPHRLEMVVAVGDGTASIVAAVPVFPSPGCFLVADAEATFDTLGMKTRRLEPVPVAVVLTPEIGDAPAITADFAVEIDRVRTVPAGHELYPRQYRSCRLVGWEGAPHLDRHEDCEWAARDIPVDADPAEVMIADGSFAVIVPSDFLDFAVWSLVDMESCYETLSGYVGVAPPAATTLRMVAGDESIGLEAFAEATQIVDKRAASTLGSPMAPRWTSLWAGSCSFPHEYMHVVMHYTPLPGWLDEGLALYMESERGGAQYDENKTCGDTGWTGTDEFGNWVENRPYVDLGNWERPAVGAREYYVTGACFWTQFEERYGHDAFQDVMRRLVAARDPWHRGCTTTLSFLGDMVEPVIGQRLGMLADRYGIDRDHSRCPYAVAADTGN